MATASITFDNSDGWLPIDFNEVAIARRAYRDGQNEYLINGQRVRLRDVSELLAKSGLAERTYTVIGQGLVDAALSLKAGERRRLFEEAAGIGLYRSRREEALRRLDSTQRNLERVQDILAELRPRIRSLERQAKRANEFKQVFVDLQELLREFYGYHWNHAQKDISEAHVAAEAQEARLEEVRREQVEIEGKLTSSRQHIQKHRTDLNAWHRQLAELHTRRELLNRNLAVAAERERAIAEASRNTQAELINRQGELRLYQEGLEDDDLEIQKIETDFGQAFTQAEEARKAMKERQAEREVAQQRVFDLQEELSSLNTRNGQLRARLSNSTAHTQRIMENMEQTRGELGVAQAEYEQLLADQKASKRQVEDAQEAHETAKRGEIEAHRKRQQLEEEGRELEGEADKSEAELARLNMQIGLLDQAEASLTGYASGTRLLIQAAQQERLKSSLGALSHYLEVPSGLEVAITAALGEYLDAVILDHDPEQALDLLMEDATRGVLIPLRQVKTLGREVNPALLGEPGVVGLAAQLVKAPQKLGAVIDLLLNQVYIVRDRPTARRLIVDQPTGVRIVTLQGEIFYASGPIQTRGASDQSADQTLLGRARQRRILTTEREKGITRQAELKQRFEALHLLGEAVRLEVEERSLAEGKAQQNLDDARSLAHRARIAIEGAQRKVEWHQTRLAEFQEDLERSETQTGTLSSELEGLEGKFEKSHAEIRVARVRLSELVLDELQSQVAQWTTHVAVLERALADARNHREDRKATIGLLEEAVQSLQTRLDTLVKDRKTLMDEQIAWRQEETGIAEQIRDLQAVIDPAELALESIENQQFEFQDIESKSMSKLSQAEHFHAQARIKLARRQEVLETWRRRIEDDLGLVAFEYVGQVSGPTPLPFGDLVEQLPIVEELAPGLDETIRRQRAQLQRIGLINPEAQEEYHEVHQRFEFLTQQVVDLRAAETDVRKVIDELDRIMKSEFLKTFNAVAAEFRGIFTRLFGGGSASLTLTDQDDISETGIDIEARLPGRRTQGLSLLSGGERSLTAVALVFSLLRVSPTPFCVLDEVDAMLDEVNVGRFRELLRELSEQTQFIIVTHNRNTVQVADVIYGVTMGRDSVSQVLSLKLDQVSEIID